MDELDEEQNMYGRNHKKNKMSLYRMNNIEALSERLGFLKIMNEASSNTNKQSDEEMPEALVTINNKKAIIFKSIVPDPGWFDRNRTKFEDWWRRIQLFLKSNKVLETDDKITEILAHLRESVVGIYSQKKLDELDEELGT